MSADQDVDLALREPFDDLADLRRPAQARDHLHREGGVGEALAEGAEVLLGEDRGRDQHHHLLAVRGRLVGGAQCHLGLPVADVAADQPVHRPLGLHVGLHRLDRIGLVGGLPVGEGGLEAELPLAVRGEGVAAAHLALGVEVEELAGHLAGGAPRPRLQVQPALAAEGAELGLAAVGADVTADPGELVGRGEDLVSAAVLELEVVAGGARQRLRVETGEAGDAMVLVDHQIADPKLDRGGEPGAGRDRCRRSAAVEEAALRDYRELQLRRQEAVPQPCLGEAHPRLLRRLVPEEGDVEAAEIEAGALGLAAALEGNDGAIAGADQLLELALGLRQGAGGEVGSLGAEGVLLPGVGGAKRQARARVQRIGEIDVEALGIVGVHRRGHVLPVIAEGAGDLLARRDRHQRRLRHQVERRAVTLNNVLGFLAVLGGELRRRCQLDPLGVAEGALGEDREPPQRLDLVAEQLHPHRPLLGRRIDVEDAAADRELAPLLDLVDTLVAGVGEEHGDVGQVHRLALVERQALRPQRPVGNGLGERYRACDDYGRRRGCPSRPARFARRNFGRVAPGHPRHRPPRSEASAVSAAMRSPAR